MTRFMGIVSGKGGVGQSTIAVNLALALHDFGRDVILIDADIDSPHIALMLGSPDLKNTIHHVLQNRMNIRDVAYRHPSGLRFIAGSILSELQEDLSTEKFYRLMNDISGTCELACVDLPHGGTRYKEILKEMTDILVVVTPDSLSITEALKTIKKAKELKKNLLGVIVNRVTGSVNELAHHTIESILELNIIGEIKESDDIPRSIRLKNPVLRIAPESDSAESIKSIAAVLIGESYKHPLPKKKKGWEFPWVSNKD